MAADIKDVDRRQERMQAPRQDGFASAASASDHHTAQAGINGGQQESEFQGAVAGDGGQGKGPGGSTTCNHGDAGGLRRGRQSR